MTALVSLAAALVLSAYDVETLRDSGPPNGRINLLILGDGYRAQDQTKLSLDAKRVTDALFAATPWREYEPLFNVQVVHLVSNQNGADLGDFGAVRDTVLNTTFCYGRALCLDDALAYQIAGEVNPFANTLVVLSNETKYGGAGGNIAVISAHELADQILVHELGHTFGQLADEYEDAYPAYPECFDECVEPNVTLNATSTVKWSRWVDSSTPIPTPELTSRYANAIGVFEGARYFTSGIYRPKDKNCRMRVLGSDYCSVCSEALTLSFAGQIELTEPTTPVAAVTVPRCALVQFGVRALVADPRTMAYQWAVNGVPTDGGSSLELAANDDLTVKVTVTHRTPLVRKNVGDLFEQNISFPLVRATGECNVCLRVTGCETDAGCSVSPLPVGTPCGPSACSSASTMKKVCSSAGACVSEPSASCAPYACDLDAGACATSCTRPEDCTGGTWCIDGACSGVDAGQPLDAGTSPADGGSSTEEPPKGCGCTSSPGLYWLWLVVLAARLARRSDF